MRRTIRQLAAVKPARFLEAGTPTGLTGLLTHASPRSSLLYIYNSTLSKLSKFPESSLYRQSAEAVTNHRLNIVKAVVPEGHKEFNEYLKGFASEHPELFTKSADALAAEGIEYKGHKIGDESFLVATVGEEYNEIETEWDGEEVKTELEGTRTAEERKWQNNMGDKRRVSGQSAIKLKPEPPLTSDQIEEIENKIGAGLIEEVIQVAEGELRLADIMLQSKVWEDLEEKPAEGQWTYFGRNP
ncbi:NADH-ubiquinone oxidoreductase 29.9 kDa subunit [Calycina marina]|uniref:NADH-ubiquinone oxidoreductase 29.9 kDa subunit n=1 Tax=Calycina marina TaxID=1763456 RepID=A0A9P7YWB2_9HELO|nr:NADH-ubiquinone oxidoreductase 29.9 kDa subunit [Calycina marina]